MRAGSLFSGVGGMDLGLARAGFEHAFFAESDSYRRDVLRARWPGVPVYDDVRDVARDRNDSDGRQHTSRPTGRSAETRLADAVGVQLLSGGFPCQDLSVAGQRRGLAGARSGLFHEFARIADALRPRWLLIENVPGLLSSNGGRDFGVVLGTLADIGYGVGWRVLDSRFFGVPQRRRRVFIVGALADGDPRAASQRAGQILAVGSRCPGHSAASGEAGADAPVASFSGLGTGGPDDNDGQGGRLMADTLREHPRPGSNSNGAMVTHALTSEGHDASEDGTGRGTPLVAVPLGGGNDGAGRRTQDDPNLVYPLARRGYSGGSELEVGERGVYNALRAGDGGSSRLNQVMIGTGVRRLTPTECERLQGWPDGWTQLGNTADSKRYAACGDGVTATVAEWIGRRLMNAHSAPAEDGGSHRKETEPSVPSP